MGQERRDHANRGSAPERYARSSGEQPLVEDWQPVVDAGSAAERVSGVSQVYGRRPLRSAAQLYGCFGRGVHDPVLKREHDFLDAVPHAVERVETEDALHFGEGHPIVARVLCDRNDADRRFGPELLLNHFDDVELAIILIRAADIEDLSPDGCGGRLQAEEDRLRGIAHMDIWPPELLAEHGQLSWSASPW